jgi:hypothetical protein
MIVGEWRADPKSGILYYRRSKGQWGECAVGTRRFMYKDLWTWLFTIATKGGVQVSCVSNWYQGTIWLSTLYNWWTGSKDGKTGWETHKAHLAFHDGTRHGAPYYRGRNMGREHFDRAILARPTLCRMICAQLPGVGFDKSAALSKRFRTVEELLGADEKEFLEVDGIGPTLAGKIWQALRSIK